MKKIQRGILILLGGLLVWGIYANTLDNEPTNWDDPALFANPSIHGLTIDNLKHALTFHNDATFQPLRDISYMIDFSLWKTTPGIIMGLHLHSILLYVIMVFFCFLFLRDLFRVFDFDTDQADFLACIATLVYAVHPVHVESITWLYARKEPLMGMFTLLCLWTFLKARIDRKNRYYLVSAAALVLAILSKPTAIVIPVLLLFLELAMRIHRQERIAWMKGALFFLPLIAFAAWQAIRLVIMMHNSAGVMPYHGGSFWTNLLAVSQIFIAYIKLTGFSFTYAADYPLKLYTALTQWQTWVYLIMNIVILASALMACMRRNYLYAFFVFWHYVFLLPVSNLLPISQIMTDRYAFLPSLSWCVLIGYLLTRLRYLPLSGARSIITPDFPRLLAYGLACFIILGYAGMTVRQNTVWRNAQTLWEHTVALYPGSFPGNVNLSILYLNQKRYADAEKACLTALANLPQTNLLGVAYLPLNNLAAAQAGQGKYAAARRNYAQVVEIDPALLPARLGLANCGWEMRDFPVVYAQYRFILEHLAVGPPRVKADVLFRAGYAAWKLGRTDEASADLSQAEQTEPTNRSRLRALAEVYDSMGLSEKAQACRVQAGP